MSRLVVAGGAGKAGRAVVRDLLEHGHDVEKASLLLGYEPAFSWRGAIGRST